ncbi:MAG: hypothetical protein PHQ36_07975 [Anaerolineales bacterium]|nr:hypothetical protein [Anaerolineales bacterium]
MWDKPFGEIRYMWKSSDPEIIPSAYALTRQTFTGQYSYMDDPSTSGVSEGFGLMFYQSRFYDPYNGRMAQADSIVPSGAQGLDRYAYANNNPVRFNDPSGHVPVAGCGEGSDDCYEDDPIIRADNAKKLASLEYDQTGQKQQQNRETAEFILGGWAQPKTKPVFGVHWGYSGQAGYGGEGGVSYQEDYMMDWKEGELYKVVTVGGFIYAGSPTGIEGNVNFGTSNAHGIPSDVENLEGILSGTQVDGSVSGNLDMGLLAGGEKAVSIDLANGKPVFTLDEGLMYTSENSIVFGGNAIPNGADFSFQGGLSYSFAKNIFSFW